MTANPIRRSFVVGLLVCGLGLSGCGSDGNSKSTGAVPGDKTTTTVAGGAPAATTATVTIPEFKFEPASLTVKVGATVTFTNSHNQPHTATADDKSFDTQSIAVGGSAPVTFGTAGTFTYFCSFHPFMKGSVTVTP